MEFLLVNGRFTANESQQLLKDLVKAKTDFHLSKVDTLSYEQEEIMNSKIRIEELERELQRVLAVIQSAEYKHVSLRAKLTVEVVPDYHNV